jgi:hypothetical protein
METLGSNWDGLHPSLIAHIRPIDYDGNLIEGEPEVVAPLLEGGTQSIEGHWQSPFEQMGPESKAPAIIAMLQSGAVLPLVNAAKSDLTNFANGQDQDSTTGFVAGNVSSWLSGRLNSVSDTLKSIRGRTSVTRINSTQIYSGMPPIKISATLYFRAWKDPVAEVMNPISQLLQWVVPQKLSPDGVIVGTLAGTSGQSGILNNLLPSTAPLLLNFRYGNQVYQKMVIESLELPITAPRDKNGNWTEVSVPVTLATLTALDRQDIIDYFRGKSPI